MPHAEYVEWQRACLGEMLRLIPSTGAIFYNHKWRPQKGLLQDRADIMAGFPVRADHHLESSRRNQLLGHVLSARLRGDLPDSQARSFGWRREPTRTVTCGP